MSRTPSSEEPYSPLDSTFGRIEELFVRALAIAPLEVPDFLEREEADAAVRREVAELLRAHFEAGTFLESPPPAAAWARPASFLGRRLGAWRLERQIGQGGMSSVYLGVRVAGDFDQQVAIKLADQGYGGSYFEARLAEERRLLSALDHPGIARLLDGGSTEEGIPYLVMELASGKPIDDHCIEGRLSLEARLRLFLEVAGAVDFAHRALIVHRDLKPAHVLVDAKGQVKLLDFGIAKLLAPRPDGRVPADSATASLLAAFTPDYASPEQFRREPATTAADVYSLGALLYRLLTGRLPRRIASLAAADVEAAFAAEPPPPSRWGLAGLPEAGQARLPRDLDAILHRALAAAPERRYPSAAALADDLRRLLSGHPVLARRPTPLYKLRLAIRRHRLASAFALLMLATVAGFLLHARNQARAVATERDRAVEERIKAEVAAAFLAEILAEGDPRRSGGGVSLREALDKGARRLHERPAGSPTERYVLVMKMGSIYRSIGAYEQARPFLAESLELARLHQSPPAVAKSLYELATWESEAGSRRKSELFHRQALELRRRHLPAGHPELLASLESLARELSFNFGTTETLELQREALELRRLGQGEQNVATLANQARYARSLTELDRFAEGCALARTTLAALDAASPEGPPGAGLLAVGIALLNCGDAASAEQVLQKALAQASPVTNYLFHNFVRNDLALVFLRQGRFDEAANGLDAARAELELKLGAFSLPLAVVTTNLAEARRGQGRLEESVQLYRQAIERFEQDQSLGGIAEARFGLGLTWLALRRHAAARRELEAALAIWKERLPPGHSQSWEAEGALARVQIGEGQAEEGKRRLAAARAALAAILGAEHPRVRRLQDVIAPADRPGHRQLVAVPASAKSNVPSFESLLSMDTPPL